MEEYRLIQFKIRRRVGLGGLNIGRRQARTRVENIVNRPPVSQEFQYVGHSDAGAFDNGLSAHYRRVLLNMLLPLHASRASFIENSKGRPKTQL